MSLERSVDGRNFNSIFSAYADEQRCLENFTYNDLDAPAGKSFYRLQIEDPDGKETYSNVVVLNNNEKVRIICSLSPNPAGSNANLDICLRKAEQITIRISDVKGCGLQTLKRNLPVGNNIINLNLSTLAPGRYQLTVITGQGLREVVSFLRQ